MEMRDSDRVAAWELYVELVTRVALLLPKGDERIALNSVHQIFGFGRDLIRKHEPGARELAKLVIPVLDQVVRPFMTKWHGPMLARAFESPASKPSRGREAAFGWQLPVRETPGGRSLVAAFRQLTLPIRRFDRGY
jgi:hypothetical protein